MPPAPARRKAGRASSAAADQPPERDTADERGQRRRRDRVLPRLALELPGQGAHSTAIAPIGRGGPGTLGRDAVVAVAAHRACVPGLGDELFLLGKGVALELVGFLAGPRLDVGLGGQRLDRIAEFLARGFDLGAKLLRALVLIV